LTVFIQEMAKHIRDKFCYNYELLSKNSEYGTPTAFHYHVVVNHPDCNFPNV